MANFAVQGSVYFVKQKKTENLKKPFQQTDPTCHRVVEGGPNNHLFLALSLKAICYFQLSHNVQILILSITMKPHMLVYNCVSL